MTLSGRNQGFQALSLVLVIALAVITTVAVGVAASAQEKISPVSDYQYKKDYAQYEGIKKEADVQKRADLFLAFMKEHPISRMLYYLASDYLECVKPHIQNKDWAKAIAMEEALLALMPTEQAVKAAGVPEPGAGEFLKNVLPLALKTIQSALMAAYYQSNNLPKAADIGEKIYAAGPDKNLASGLANIYLQLKNTDKYLTYAEKLLAEIPIEQSYPMAMQVAGVYFGKQENKKALDLIRKVMDVYGEKVPPNVQEAAWNITREFAYKQLGADAYTKKDYPKAIELYGKSAKFGSKADDVAYYYIGMSKWNTQDPEGAIESFAKAAVLGKANASKSEGFLNQLCKARHPENAACAEEAKTKAKNDLGIK